MKPSYAVFWLFFFSALGAGAYWDSGGRAEWRRRCCAPAEAPAEARSESHFLALVFPRITPERDRFTIAERDFERFLESLKASGYAPIGEKDIRDFYFRGRPLPPKAVFLALDRDDPRSVRMADRVLMRLRMRAAVFLDRTGPPRRRHRWHRLSPHAVTRLERSGAWDLGRLEKPGPDPVYRIDTPEGPLRFVPGKTAYNDERSDPAALRVLWVRSDRPLESTLRRIASMLPRGDEFATDFRDGEVGPEWVVDWGAVAASRKRLALLPAPDQTGASVFLAGTERWDDVEIEMELAETSGDFWAYLRSGSEPERYVRIGVTDGRWRLQQFDGKTEGPVTLGVQRRGRAVPARVRFVVKGGWAVASVNGRLAFDRAFRVDPAIDRGPVRLLTYGPRLASSRSFLRHFEARPLPSRVLEVKSVSLEETEFDRLRELAFGARGIAVPVARILRDGSLEVRAEPPRLLRALAGFYGCSLLATVEVSGEAAAGLAGPLARPAAKDLAQAARQMGFDGVNVRLEAGAARQPALAGFLRAAELEVGAGGGRLWVTAPEEARLAWRAPPDRMLRHAGSERGFDVLEAPAGRGAPPEFPAASGLEARRPPAAASR